MAWKALKDYREIFQDDPKSELAAWRLSMACYFTGHRLTKEKEQQRTIFSEGRDAALSAITVNPSCAPCHFWVAVNMALYGEATGIFKAISSLGDIRDHLRESIKLDPKFGNGSAYRVMGVIDQKLPGIFGGSNARARENFEKALQVAPYEPLNYLAMIKLLRDEMGKEDEARMIARKAHALSKPDPDQIESQEALQEIREWLKKTTPEVGP
jgi:tetratricopeptide (TPR) repeat protein